MTVLEKTDLRDQILKVLMQKGKALRLPEIELALKNEGHWLADTFDVRDAVAKLIEEEKVDEIHPGRMVRLPQH